MCVFFFFFSSRRRHTRCYRDWSSDVCSSDLETTAKDIGRLESRPSFRNALGCRSKIAATGGQSGAIDRSCGSASDDRKRITVGAGAFQFANALENTGLISAASTAPGHDQTDRVFHRPSLGSLWERPVQSQLPIQPHAATGIPLPGSVATVTQSSPWSAAMIGDLATPMVLDIDLLPSAIQLPANAIQPHWAHPWL